MLRRLVTLAWLLGCGALALSLSGPVAADASGCGPAKPDPGKITFAPANAELPVGASATFQATVWKPGKLPQAGRRVSFRVVCGPNRGHAAAGETDVHKASGSDAPSAYFTATDRKGLGTDLISASTVVAGKREAATASVSWVAPVDCGQPLVKLGYLLALQCKLPAAKPLQKSVLEVAQCGIGVTTFLAPAAKLATLVDEADKAGTAARLAKDAGVHMGLAKLAFDLSRLQKHGIVTSAQLKNTLEGAHSLPGFLHGITALLATIPSADVSAIALDVADLTSVRPCLTLLAEIVGASSQGTGTGTGPGTTPSSFTLSLFAGSGDSDVPAPGPATQSPLGQPSDVVVDRQGNVYITDLDNDVVEKVTPAGTLSVVAGQVGQDGPTTPGPAVDSNIDLDSDSECGGIAINAAGDLFVADCGNDVIDKITPAGQLSVVAGEVGQAGAPTAGPATDSQLDDPAGVAVDSAGNLYIADDGNDVIEKVTPAGQLSIFAGVVDDFEDAPTPGPATQSAIGPAELAVDAAGDVYAADGLNNVVEKITPAGQLSIVAGQVGEGGAPTPGPATASQLSFEACGGQVAVSSNGTLYIADCGNDVVEQVTPSGQLSIVAGQAGQYGTPTPGPATSSPLGAPTGLALDGLGNIYIADAGNSVVEKLTPAS
jgi:hypothetical protein